MAKVFTGQIPLLREDSGTQRDTRCVSSARKAILLLLAQWGIFMMIYQYSFRVSTSRHAAVHSDARIDLYPSRGIAEYEKACGNYSNYITAGSTGRLGNQMFQYAALLGITATNNNKYLNISSDSPLSHTILPCPLIPFYRTQTLLNGTFPVTHLTDDHPWKNFTRIWEKGSALYDARYADITSTHNRKDIYIGNFLQSYKYFQHIEAIIRKEFTFLPNVVGPASAMLKKITQQELEEMQRNTRLRPAIVPLPVPESKALDKGSPSPTPSSLPQSSAVLKVGIHVRRGDYVRKLVEGQWKLPPPSYYNNAAEYYRKKYGDENVLFVVVSEDLKYCRENLELGQHVVFAEKASAPVHMALLSLCDHIIYGMGSYGWWAGYLSVGDVVYYNNCVYPNMTAMKRFKAEDHFMPHWIGIGDSEEGGAEASRSPPSPPR